MLSHLITTSSLQRKLSLKRKVKVWTKVAKNHSMTSYKVRRESITQDRGKKYRIEPKMNRFYQIWKYSAKAKGFHCWPPKFYSKDSAFVFVLELFFLFLSLKQVMEQEMDNNF